MPGRIFRQRQWWKQQHPSNVAVAKRVSTADENRKAISTLVVLNMQKAFCLVEITRSIYLSISLYNDVCLHSKVAHIESAQTIIFSEAVAENAEVNYGNGLDKKETV
jgi:hypothetical protein